MSVLGVLGIVFVVLKLVGTIAWSWWLVLLPFYAIPLIWVTFLGFVALCAALSK